jgi:hypothetical protein
MSYYIIDTGSPGESSGSCSTIGPFASLAAAERWLRDDAADTYLNADASIRELSTDVPWSEPMHIVKIIKTVRPVPTAIVKVRLETVKETT